MLNAITFKNTRLLTCAHQQLRKLLTTVHRFKEERKQFLMRCVFIYMAVKIVIILLATFTTLFFVTNSVSGYLAIEMSRTKVILFTAPLTLIIVLKLYFIFMVLLTYDRSRYVIKTALRVALLKGKRGIQRVKETLPERQSALSLEKIVNR